MRGVASLTFVRTIGFAGAVACSAGLGIAFAAEPKTGFSVKTKWVEATVILDARVKADPALAANCLAEGKAWAAKNRADADKERKQDPGLFRNAWSFERKYDTRSVVDGRYLSIVRSDYEYTGGAHPNSSSNTILWDKSAGKRISIRPFFTETADNGPTLKAMRQGVIASLEAEKKKRGAEGTDASAIEAIEPKLLKIGPVSLAPSTEEGKSSGLTFHYAPYACRLLRRRRVRRLRAVGSIEAISHGGGRQDLRRRAAEG